MNPAIVAAEKAKARAAWPAVLREVDAAIARKDFDSAEAKLRDVEAIRDDLPDYGTAEERIRQARDDQQVFELTVGPVIGMLDDVVYFHANRTALTKLGGDYARQCRSV